MGINICLYGPDYKEHPDWDSGRLGGDREFAAMLGKELPTVDRCRLPFPDIEWEYRPTDFAVWRWALASREWPNPGRFERLTDLLEANPDYWIYVSY